MTSIVGACGCGSGGSETTTVTYDERLNVVKKVDALSNETTYTYDVDGNLTSITDPIGTQEFTYNSIGKVLTHTDRMDGETVNTYDSDGNLLTTTDPLDNTTTFTYTSIGQLATVEDARENATVFTYDSSGRLITVTDANDKETDFTHGSRETMKFELGEIIAERKLQVISGERTGTIVEVFLGRPRKVPDSPDFFTPYLIKGCDEEKLQCAVGIDAFQALHLALGILTVELEAFQRKHNVKLFWDGDESGRLGFDY